MSLCETFRSLAFSTSTHLAKARRVGHQPLEETLTDVNLLELKDRHPKEIFTKVFTKPREGLNGADWEWWLTDSTMGKWLGLRVQAKVVSLSSDRFEHLHYKKGKTYQATKLKRVCAQDGLIPLYCVYAHGSQPQLTGGLACQSFAHAPESYGCALVPLQHVEKLRRDSHNNTVAAVMSGALPWHCLVCCSGYGGDNLPERAWQFLQHGMGMELSGRPARDTPGVGIREDPPAYVRMVVHGEQEVEGSAFPEAVRGIVVVREQKS